MIAGIGSQLRFVTVGGADGTTTRPIGLDFTAVILTGREMGVDMALVADILPRIEAAIVTPLQGEREEDDDANP